MEMVDMKLILMAQVHFTMGTDKACLVVGII